MWVFGKHGADCISIWQSSSTSNLTIPNPPVITSTMATQKDFAAVTSEDVGAEKGHVTKQHVAGSALLINKQGGIRKLPVPSNNPNDPLNWKTWEKAAVISCCCWFCTHDCGHLLFCCGLT